MAVAAGLEDPPVVAVAEAAAEPLGEAEARGVADPAATDAAGEGDPPGEAETEAEALGEADEAASSPPQATRASTVMRGTPRAAIRGRLMASIVARDGKAATAVSRHSNQRVIRQGEPTVWRGDAAAREADAEQGV